MKQRFSSLDVKVIAQELSSALCSLRLANIYDLSSRIFLFKFAKPDNRQQMIVDAGFRCHLTSFARTTAGTPSPFVGRLRRFLRTRRVTSVSQVGTDRIIDIQFSDGQYRLFLEFYAAGNIILTDKDLNILALFRNVSEGAEHEQSRIGLGYNLSTRQNYHEVPPLTLERIRDGLQKAAESSNEQGAPPSKRKGKQKASDSLRRVLASITPEYPPPLLEHALRVREFEPSTRPEQVLESEVLLQGILEVLREAQRTVQQIASTDVIKGYIIAKPSKNQQGLVSTGESNSPEAGITAKSKDLYEDFHPFRPRQFDDDPSCALLEFQGFNKTVDEFFSSIEGQRLESKLQEREDIAKQKLEKARQDHAKRLGGLQQVQELNVRKAQAIEANLDRVDEVTAAVNGLIAQGMDWLEIDKLIELEQSRQNPVALTVKLPLKLHENTATLLLAEWEDDFDQDLEGDVTESEASGDEDESHKPNDKTSAKGETRVAVDIDLDISAWSNARQYYDQKKTAAVKEEKTQQASAKALKSTEQKIAADLRKGLKQEKQVLRPVRRQFWFERFMYFVSSDGYLVIGGKDAPQNDVLYRKYLKRGDVYVHADLQGAASVIIKNNPSTPDAPIPPSTLSQAGSYSVITSSAWDSKAVMSAWWVNSDQVSKTAPTGEYLATGAFTIRGQKNFLPPTQLLLGFAVIFEISDESKARHAKHRLVDEQPDGAAQSQDVIGQHDETKSRGKGTASEDDGDSLDARISTSSEDEDFPDAKLDSDSEESEDEGDHFVRASNPLQTQFKAVAIDGDTLDSKPDRGIREAQGTADLDAVKPIVSGNVSDDGSIGANREASKGNVKHLSAHERKLLKKQASTASISQSVDAADDSLTSESEDESQTSIAHPTGPSPGPSTKGPAKVRGKKGKQKKLAQKYVAQDEDDRELAMRLLGSKSGQQKAKDDAEAKKAKEEEAKLAKQRRREQHQRSQKEGKEAEELRRLQQEDGVQDADEDESSQTIDLGCFTGRPLPGDEILEAIPVCAPWSCLGKYKYKAKLQPGSQKKGKAVREILAKWSGDGGDKKKVDERSEDTEKMWPREIGLIRAWRDTEVVGVVPVKTMRVMLPGVGGGKGGGGKGKARGGRGSKKAKS